MVEVHVDLYIYIYTRENKIKPSIIFLSYDDWVSSSLRHNTYPDISFHLWARKGAVNSSVGNLYNVCVYIYLYGRRSMRWHTLYLEGKRC